MYALGPVVALFSDLQEGFQVRVALQTYFGGFPQEAIQVRVDFRT